MSTRYKDLPEDLKGLVIQLVLENARSNAYLDPGAARTAMDTASAILAYGEAKSDETSDDDLVTETAEGTAVTGQEHCGRPDCDACNIVFGKVGVDPAQGESSDALDALAFALGAALKQKPRFVQIHVMPGAQGVLHVYQNRQEDTVFALSANGKTAVIKTTQPVFDMPYALAMQIVEVHGSADLNIQ